MTHIHKRHGIVFDYFRTGTNQRTRIIFILVDLLILTFFYSVDTDIPYWMIVIWCVAGVLVVIMIIVAIYYSYVICCQRRNRKNKR